MWNGPVKDRVLVPYRQAVFPVFARAHLSKVFGGSVDAFFTISTPLPITGERRPGD